MTAANENGDAGVGPTYRDRQHTSSDILGVDTDIDGKIDSFFVDFNYLGRNTVMNGCAAGMAAISPNVPDFTFAVEGFTNLKVTITQQTQYGKYKVGLRTTTNDWDSVYYFTGTSFSIPAGPADYIASVSSIDSKGVESLFSREYMAKISGTGSKKESVKSIELLQSKPNPADESTMISILVNKHVSFKAAYISITDLTGKEVERMPVELNEGINEVQYDHGYHQSGTYIYTLVIDGNPIQSRRMMFVN